MDETENEIFNLINAHRHENGLEPLERSANLAYVARTHAVDYIENVDDSVSGHSWSNKGVWTAVNYTSDHKYRDLMWSKPSEISNYKSSDIEISAGRWGSDKRKSKIDATTHLYMRKASPGHNAVMIQKDAFVNTPMLAMSVGVYKGYACVWFRQTRDTLPASK